MLILGTGIFWEGTLIALRNIQKKRKTFLVEFISHKQLSIFRLKTFIGTYDNIDEWMMETD